jgi:sarcosine oxidase subunit beta
MGDRIHYLDRAPVSADLVIVGGGVVGAATAFHATREGLKPLVLERHPRLCTLTTPASTGAFRLQFDNQEELELVRESVQIFLHFSEVTGQSLYELGIRQPGYLWLTTSETGVERQRGLVDAQRSWGQTDIELLNAEETRRRFPYVSSQVLQARFRQADGFLDPKQLTLGLVAGSDAHILTDCTVMGFRIEHETLTGVITTRGVVSTKAVVICAGPFSGNLAGAADVHLPVSTVLRQKLILPVAPEVPSNAPMTIDDDTGAHWRPALQGAFVLFTDPETPPSPPLEDVALDYRFAFRLLDPTSPVAVARVSPFWRRVWERSAVNWLLQGGYYTMTPDHRPLIGPTPIEGLFVNTGYSGHGIMGSPAGSRLLVDSLVGKLSPLENPFRLDREFAQREHDLL